jgi:hypothetical protein
MTQPIFAFCQCFPFAAKTLLNVKFCQILSTICVCVCVCVCVIQAVFAFPYPVQLIHVFVYESNTKKMNLNSSFHSSSQIRQTQCKDQWKMWACGFQQLLNASRTSWRAQRRHTYLVFCTIVIGCCRRDPIAQWRVLLHSSTDSLIYSVFNDVLLTIQMGQFAVDPEIQPWRVWRLSLCSDQLLQTWLQSLRHTWQWSWPWSGKKMTEREKAVAAP